MNKWIKKSEKLYESPIGYIQLSPKGLWFGSVKFRYKSGHKAERIIEGKFPILNAAQDAVENYASWMRYSGYKIGDQNGKESEGDRECKLQC